LKWLYYSLAEGGNACSHHSGGGTALPQARSSHLTKQSRTRRNERMAEANEGNGRARPGGLTYAEIVKITGPVDAAKIALILAARPTAEELEEAVVWAAGESDVMGELRRPLTGMVARLFDILTADQSLEERD
jgi:hypothetical protein